jgi:hypothetical protein
MKFCRESEESRGEDFFDTEKFEDVCWVWMQLDIEIFKPRGVFLISLIGLLSLGSNLKSPIGCDLKIPVESSLRQPCLVLGRIMRGLHVYSVYQVKLCGVS